MLDMRVPLALHLLKVFPYPRTVMILNLTHILLVLSEYPPILADLLDDVTVDMLVVVIDTGMDTLTIGFELNIQLIDGSYEGVDPGPVGRDL